MFVVVSAMVSGAATLLNTMFNINMVIGTIVFSFALILLVLKGTELVTKVNGILTIIILAIVIYITVIGIGHTWEEMSAFLAAHIQTEDYGFSSKIYAWFVILGSLFNFLTGANAAVPACLKSINTKKDVFVASFVNVALCAGATIICTIMFSAVMS